MKVIYNIFEFLSLLLRKENNKNIADFYWNNFFALKEYKNYKEGLYVNKWWHKKVNEKEL